MGNLFGKKKAISRVTNHDKAVLQMKQQRDKLKQYQQRIERTLETERQLAKRLLSEGKRDRAKLLLKKKRYQEQMLQRADGQLENIERLINDLEFTAIESQVLDGLKVGNEALKKANEMMSIDEIEQIMEETREGIDKQNEISELLSGALTAEDEDAVEEEFNELVAADEETKIAQLPEAPTDELPEKEDETEHFEDAIKEKVVAEKKPKRIAVAAD